MGIHFSDRIEFEVNMQVRSIKPGGKRNRFKQHIAAKTIRYGGHAITHVRKGERVFEATVTLSFEIDERRFDLILPESDADGLRIQLDECLATIQKEREKRGL